LYNGGDVKFSATTLAHVAHAVVGVLENPTETANRLIYVHSAATSQNQLIEYATQIDGRGWTTSAASTVDVLGESRWTLGNGGNEMDAMNGFCVVAM